MGLNTFTIGLSGLNTNGHGLEVVGNNLANLNTVGFKASTISFSEVIGRLGSQVSGIHPGFSQGGVQGSTNPLDLAIQGRGFFALSDQGNRYYTRAGNLHLDSNGFLVAENGMNVQGFQRNPATGAIDQNLGIGNIQFPSGLMPPVPTSEFQLGLNLDSNAVTGAKFSATVQLYDSQGKSHMATMSLEKDIDPAGPTTRWRFDLTIPESEISGASPLSTDRYSLLTGAVVVPGDPVVAGALVFDTSGALVSSYIGADPAAPPPVTDIDVPPGAVVIPALANGAVLSPISWKLVSTGSEAGITGFASASEMSFVDQNGSAPGSMSSVFVLPDGTFAATFSNGRTMAVGQLILAQFSNLQGLASEGGGLYSETPASGISRTSVPGSAGLGTVLGSVLEQSNVDLASELTKIITFQRGYQASARIITTSDQILQETLNLLQ